MLNHRGYLKLIEPWLTTMKVLVIYGARQVGKTSILEILRNQVKDMVILSAENPAVRDALESKNLDQFKFLASGAKIVAIDEAQKIEDIGNILKYIHDSDIGIQLIATGSSSFDLSYKVTEPLTGRNVKFTIYPYALSELVKNKSAIWLTENLERLLIYGQYPEIVDSEVYHRKILLQNLTSDYLFQDILQLENLRNSSDLRKILKALALQIGSEVSYHEIAQLLGISPRTVEKYIDLMEKNFIIYTLTSYSRNLRNELKKSKKIYFTDLGIRNAIVNNFAPLMNRTDKGALWENFCINEIRKRNVLRQRVVNQYFWRTYDQAEIDLIEEYDGKLDIYEFKYNMKKKKVKFPQSFLDNYPVRSKHIIHLGNFYELMGIDMEAD